MSITRFLAGLSPDEDRRTAEIRELVSKSSSPGWERETAILMYQDAGSGKWDVTALADVQALLTAIEANPELLTIVEPDIEQLLQRLERYGASFRGTWNWVRSSIQRHTTRAAA